MAYEDVPLIVIQPLGHSNLGITSVYLQGIDNAEIIGGCSRPPSADGASERGAPPLKRDRSRAAHRALRKPGASCS